MVFIKFLRGFVFVGLDFRTLLTTSSKSTIEVFYFDRIDFMLTQELLRE